MDVLNSIVERPAKRILIQRQPKSPQTTTISKKNSTSAPSSSKKIDSRHISNPKISKLQPNSSIKTHSVNPSSDSLKPTSTGGRVSYVRRANKVTEASSSFSSNRRPAKKTNDDKSAEHSNFSLSLSRSQPCNSLKSTPKASVSRRVQNSNSCMQISSCPVPPSTYRIPTSSHQSVSKSTTGLCLRPPLSNCAFPPSRPLGSNSCRIFTPSRPSESPSSVYPRQRCSRPSVRPSNLSLQSLRGLIGKSIGRGKAFLSSNTCSSLLPSSEESKAPAISKAKVGPKISAEARIDGAPQPKTVRVGGVPQPSIGPCYRSLLPHGSRNAPQYRHCNGMVPSRGLAIAAQRLGATQRIGKDRQQCDPYGLDVYDEDDLNFIDDGPLDDYYEQGTSTTNWKSELRGITGYDPTIYAGKDEEARESSWTQQEQEELRSSKIGAHEDAIETKRIQEEEARERRLKEQKSKTSVTELENSSTIEAFN